MPSFIVTVEEERRISGWLQGSAGEGEFFTGEPTYHFQRLERVVTDQYEEEPRQFVRPCKRVGLVLLTGILLSIPGKTKKTIPYSSHISPLD